MKITTIALITTLVFSAPTITYADCQLSWCKKAKTTAEKAVCRNKVLRASDELMNLLYSNILNNKNILMGTRGTVKDDQRAFIKLRDEVAYSEMALQNIYLDRIAELQNIIKQNQPDI